jgi:hypothetical protein
LAGELETGLEDVEYNVIVRVDPARTNPDRQGSLAIIGAGMVLGDWRAAHILDSQRVSRKKTGAAGQ